MNYKEDLTCKNCNIILNEPISLPCGCWICNHHVPHECAKRKKTIKCVSCNKYYYIPKDGYRINKTAKKLLEQEMFLSQEEKQFKESLQLELNDLQRQLEALKTNANERSNEIRIKIETRNSQLKQQIDNISNQMITTLNETEENILFEINHSQLETHFKKVLNDNQQSPFNLIKLNELKDSMHSTLTEKFQLLSNQLKSIDFEPNKIDLDTKLFGKLEMMNERIISPKILSSHQSLELMDLCEFGLDDKFKLIYAASGDEFSSRDFHAKCDNRSKTLIVIKSEPFGYIFGGYTEATWDSPHGKQWKSDPNAFLFSLTNRDNRPCKMKSIDESHSIYCNPYCGPTFGQGHDIWITDNQINTNGNCSNLGLTYRHPQYEHNSSDVKTFLAGKVWFKFNVIEIYQRD